MSASSNLPPAPSKPRGMSRKAARARLFLAIRNNDPAMAQEALSAGASANDQEENGSSKDSAFLLSLRQGRFACAEILWPLADPTLRGEGGQSFLMLAAAAKSEAWTRRALLSCDPAATDNNGRDALRVAADLNYVELASALIPLCDPDGRDKSGETSLRSALRRGSQACAMLLARASKNLALHEPCRLSLQGELAERSLAQLAAEFGRFEAYELLVSLGATNELTAIGETPLMLAASRGASDFVRKILPQSNPLARDKLGRDALTRAIEIGSQSCCELLLPVSELHGRDALGRSLMDVAREDKSHARAELADWLGAHRERLVLERQTAEAPARPTRAARPSL